MDNDSTLNKIVIVNPPQKCKITVFFEFFFVLIKKLG